MAPVLSDAINSLKTQIGAGSNYHLDKAEYSVTAPDADTAPKAYVLANQLLAVCIFHAQDLLAHKAFPAGDGGDEILAFVKATDDTTCIALVLALAEWYTDHIGLTSAHYSADSTNTLTSLTVTTIGQAETVATDMKAKLNAHFSSDTLAGPSAPSIRLTDA
jgi:hypothetical protein